MEYNFCHLQRGTEFFRPTSRYRAKRGDSVRSGFSARAASRVCNGPARRRRRSSRCSEHARARGSVDDGDLYPREWHPVARYRESPAPTRRAQTQGAPSVKAPRPVDFQETLEGDAATLVEAIVATADKRGLAVRGLQAGADRISHQPYHRLSDLGERRCA